MRVLLFERVLVPVDFSELSETVLHYGTELTHPDGTTIVVHVLEPLPMHFESAFGTFVNTEGLVRIRENARQLLDELERKHSPRRLVTELREGKPHQQILSAAEEHRADLIVQGSHGRGGLEALFLGSVAAKILRKAACPVLTIRQPRGRK
ncbi:MAG: universal stress protein [Planctomycetota bacterium]